MGQWRALRKIKESLSNTPIKRAAVLSAYIKDQKSPTFREYKKHVSRKLGLNNKRLSRGRQHRASVLQSDNASWSFTKRKTRSDALNDDFWTSPGYDSIIRNFFETAQAKGAKDAAGGYIKREADFSVIRGRSSIQNGKDLFNFCHNNLQKPKSTGCKRRIFRCVETIPRNTTQHFKSIADIRKIHCVKTTNNSELMVTDLSCYTCDQCVSANYELYRNFRFRGNSRPVKIVREHSTENHAVENNNSGDTLLDLISNGTIIAVVAEDDDSDVYLMKTLGEPEILPSAVTDGWGISFPRGANVVKGYYYDIVSKRNFSYKLVPKRLAINYSVSARYILTESEITKSGNIGGRSSGGSGSGVLIGYRPVTPVPCDCYAALLKKCILVHIPIVGCLASEGNLAASTIASCALQEFFPVIGCAVSADKLTTSSGPNLPDAIIDTAMSCVVGPLCSVCGKVYKALRCIQALEQECGNKRKRRDVSSDVVNNVIVTSKPMNNFRSMVEEIFGNEEMFHVNKEWYSAFKTVISDNSESGSILSRDEKSFVLNTVTSNISNPILDRFLERWNNTVSAWDNGTLNEEIKTGSVINLSRLSLMMQQYIKDTKTAADRGFNSIFSDFDHALNAYVLAEQETQAEGSSKKDGARCLFNARFEIENGENTALESIHVQIEIKHNTGSGEVVNDLFSIGDPDLLGLTGVDGDGRLGVDLSGSAEWLIIPYSTAAPNDDVLFNVGGRLSYRVGGSNFSVPLLPDTITVKPNPSLVLHYFHEKYVRGDDPLTTEEEPVIPFTLAVMVRNSGYGIARALKISSAQPQIIENEKGLLITFKIIGGFLDNEPITPSLIVDFGDIKSFETKTARWMLTSTLKGTFYNFSATFENINPLGDPQLSLFENVWYHELIHLVRLFRDDQDDGFDDFLVNDFVDNKGIPEKVYNSANGSDVYDVMSANALGLSSSTFVKSDMITYTLVYMEVLTNTSNWFYARVKNNITRPHQTLLSVKSDDNRDIVVDENIWTTTHVLDSNLIHLFDFIKSNNSVSEKIEMKYVLTFGPKNMYPPKFNKTSYSITLSTETQKEMRILTVHAYDLDKNDITFEITGFENETFAIDSYTGVVTLLQSPLEVGEIRLQVMCRDDGIPSLSDVVNVIIYVTSDEIMTTTLVASSEASTDISVTSQSNNLLTYSVKFSSTSIVSSTNIVFSTEVETTTESASDKTTVPDISTGVLDMTHKSSASETKVPATSTGAVVMTTESSFYKTTVPFTSTSAVDQTSKSSYDKNKITVSSPSAIQTTFSSSSAVNLVIYSVPLVASNFILLALFNN
ncbi:unnamed protein product [Mytilus coruscus]|uniref:Cadherin domain-containing protein n=1 Tax=Mytilus coruscus TaxID=42192 RepID=A0A6J8EKG1_MYTCO|nr:unnamed protein product [Mytilus coruscus]